MYMKIKKKPTEGDQPIKGKKVEKKKNSKEEKGEQLGKEKKVSEKQKNKKGGKTDNDQLKGGGSTTEVRKVEDTDQGTINKIVQKVSKENIGFHFMCNNRDIIENSFEIEDDNEEGSVTNDDALMNEQESQKRILLLSE
ncbi:hypothetical protein JTB14_012034 [Gonioctena quinquepunctata]|nr:hypothetical protein JTB14_012034 [Gonioctena quinquepunctata]